MKPSNSLRFSLLYLIGLATAAHSDTLIPGSDGPHANKDYVFNGQVHVWANELYDYNDGQAVILNNAGEVEIQGPVAPKSISALGDNDSVLTGIGQITGDITLTKEGSGTLVLNSNNSYTGNTQLLEGQITAGGDTSFGSSSVQVLGGTLRLNGYAVANDIYLQGGELVGASDFMGRLFVEEDVQFNSDTGARELIITPGKSVSVAGGISLSTQETLKLDQGRILDLSAGGSLNSSLHVASDGVLRLSTNGTASIADGCTWHLENAQVSGSLSTARQTAASAFARASGSGSVLRISGNSSLSGALTLNGGTLSFSDATASLRAGTLVLSKSTALQWDKALETGQSHTFLKYNRLLSGTVTDYYDFFSVSAEDYTLDITTDSITITALEPQPTPTPDPVVPPTPTPPTDDENTTTDDPGPIIPTPEEDKPTTDNESGDDPHDSKDPGPVIDTSGNNENDPHNNKEDNSSGNSNGSTDNGVEYHPTSGSALSQAGMQSAWGAAHASDIFMQTVHDWSRHGGASTWFAFMGGIMENDNETTLPGGEAQAYGVAVGASATAGDNTRLGLALGGSIGSISGDSFGELDQSTMQAAIYLHHAFLPTDSTNSLGLYVALGGGRTETDPGSYSGLETWHHNNLSANSRLTWGVRVSEQLSWNLYGGFDYYHTGSIDAGDETISSLSYGRGRLGTGVVWQSGDTTLYTEIEFTGDILRDDPTATHNDTEFQTSNPERCGFALHAGVLLTPEKSERTVGLHYSFETRSSSTAHIISVSLDHLF